MNARRKYNLQQLHWEILEDTSRWSDNVNYEKISVCTCSSMPPIKAPSGTAGSRTNILLVTCRPKGRNDIDAQLISQSIVETIQASAAISDVGDVRLDILRPPTWLAFEEHLLYDYESCLTGLSRQGAVQLAESHTHWTSKVSNTEDRDFAERISILLERSPLAIKLVFPVLGLDIGTPETLHQRLLYGTVNVDTIEAANSKYVSRINWILVTFAFGKFGYFTPGLLSPFCNFFPKDLRDYIWFFLVPGFKEGTSIRQEVDSATLGNWAQSAWQERVHEAMEVFGYENFGEMVDALTEECILDEVEITDADGSINQGYHVNPIFTIVQRSANINSLQLAMEEDDDAAVERMQSLHRLVGTAFVNFQILEDRFATNIRQTGQGCRNSRHISRLVWDKKSSIKTITPTISLQRLLDHWIRTSWPRYIVMACRQRT